MCWTQLDLLGIPLSLAVLLHIAALLLTCVALQFASRLRGAPAASHAQPSHN